MSRGCRVCGSDHPPVNVCESGLRDRLLILEAHLAAIRAVVDEQAEDAGLWFVAVYSSEAYLQAALRRLHRVVEGK